MDPILFAEKRAHAEKLIREGYFADAIPALEELARDRSPFGQEHAQWAWESLPKTKAALQKSRAECQEAVVLAEQLFNDFAYAEAVDVLEKFKRGSRLPDAEELLRECKRMLKKIARLNEAIDRGIYHQETRTDEFLDTLEDFLELNPKDRRAKALYKKLQKERHQENHLGWRLGLVLLSLFCLLAAGWVGKLIFWPEEQGTITITLTEPDLVVSIDGEVLPESDFDKKLDRYEEGEHRLELRHGLDVVARHTFTIVPNVHKILEVPGEEVEIDTPPPEPLPELPEPVAVIEPPERLNPEPFPPDPIPPPDPPMEPMPPPPPVIPEINGFPIAKQTGYFHLKGPRVTPRFATFNADSTRVAAERLTSEPLDPQKVYEIAIWDTGTGEPVRTLSTHAGELEGLAFSPDGKQIAAALVHSPEPTGGLIQIWDVESGELQQTLLLTVPPAQETVAVNGLAFSPDGKTIAALNQDSAFVWIISDGRVRFQKSFAPSELTSIGFFPVGEILIVGTATPGNTSDGIISWDMERDAQRGFLSAGFSNDNPHPVFAISRDQSVATVLNENAIRRYGVERANPLGSASLPRFLGEEEPMTRLAYSPSGVYVMASARGRRPLIWRDSDLTKVAILGESSIVGSYAVKFSSDSRSVYQLDHPDENDFSPCAAVIRTWEIPE